MAVQDVLSALMGTGQAPTPNTPLPTLTPESVKRRRLQAMMQQKEGMSYAPVQHWTQGAARVSQALLGALEERDLDKQERAGLASIGGTVGDIAAREMGGAGPAPAMAGAAPGGQASAGLPSFARTGGKMASAMPIGGFDQSVNRVLGFEGGYTPDDAGKGPTNFGINSQSNPGVDVAKLTPEGAKQIYKAKYWDAIGGDQLAQQNPALAHVAFDAAVNSGPGKAAEWLKASGGDPNKFLQLRSDFLGGLVQSDPGKYGKYANAWSQRLASLQADINGGQAAMQAPGQQGGAATYAAAAPGQTPAPPAAVAQPAPSGASPRVVTALASPSGTASDAPAIGFNPPNPVVAALGNQPTAPGGMQLPPEASGPAPAPAQAPPSGPTPPTMARGGVEAPPPQMVAQVTQLAAQPQVQAAAQAHAQTPEGQQTIQQAGKASVQQIYSALTNPWISDSQKSVLTMILKKRLEDADPVRQLQLQKLQGEVNNMPLQRRGLELGNEKAGFDLQTARTNAPLDTQAKQIGNQAATFDLSTKQNNAPLDTQAKKLANEKAQRDLDGEGATPLSAEDRVALGIPKNQPAYKTRSGEIKFGPVGTTIRNEGAIPPGMQAVRDEDGAIKRLEPIPGSKESNADAQRKLGEQIQADAVVKTVDRVYKLLDSDTLPKTGGMGNMLSKVPGTASHDMSELIKSLEAITSFEQLAKMRQASPTGGALGGVSDKETGLLAAAIASLKQSQSEEQLRENLSIVKERYLDTVHGKGNNPKMPGQLEYGHVEDGHRYIGGNPASPKSWTKVQ